jgi:hypothetical protein
MCLYPRLIWNKKYTSTKKNGGEIPHCDDERKKRVPVGCGKCMECKKQKSREWQVRLSEEIRDNKNGKFVTLTFSDEELQKIDDKIDKEVQGYNRDNAICSYAVRHFTENWRKTHKKTIRHWLVTEIGGTRSERIHLHGILFTDNEEEIKKKWKYGFVYIGEFVNEKTINYIIKYINKADEKHKEYNSKVYASKGIGKNYLERKDSKRHKYKEKETIETYKTRAGLELALPIYYRNKVFTEEEREKLWVEKLDKDERWVCGVRVDIKNGDQEYYELLNEKRILNKRLGYGDDEKDWEQERYEKQRRNLKRWERIQKLKTSK